MEEYIKEELKEIKVFNDIFNFYLSKINKN